MSASLLVRDVRRFAGVPLPWVLGALGVLAAVVTALGLSALDSRGNAAGAVSALPMLAGLLGAVGVGAEFRFGTLHTEVLLHGGRLSLWWRLSCAAALVAGVVGAVSATAAVVATALLSDGARPAGAAFVLTAAPVSAGWAVLGGSLAAVVANQAAAVGVLMGYLVLAEPMLEASSGRLSGLLPARLAAELLGHPAPGALLRLALVVVLVWAGAGAVLLRRDVPVVSR